MNKFVTNLVIVLLVLAVSPVLAVDTGTSITPDITIEDFVPMIWECGTRTVLDDGVEPGRCTEDGQDMSERDHNYAFEGEQVEWTVLVLEKNGIEKISDVYVGLSPSDIICDDDCMLDKILGGQDAEDFDIEANCKLVEVLREGDKIDSSCNARILEETLSEVPSDNMAAKYRCTLTVETADSMQGEFWAAPIVVDLDDNFAVIDEKDYWFFNPEIGLNLYGDMSFEDVRPGSDAYSDALLIENAAEAGSGVMLDMYVSGTNFYDSDSSGAKCPVTNELALTNFRYYATHGAYVSHFEGGPVDGEGYMSIPLGDKITSSKEIVGQDTYAAAHADNSCTTEPDTGNVLSPGDEMSMTFKLSVPEPCNGNFDTGDIFFWGEAI